MSGADQFKAWIRRQKFKTFTAAAEFLGLDKSIVTKLAKGTRCPGRTSAIRLERQTGIPVEAWGSGVADRFGKVRPRKVRNRIQDKVSTANV